MEDEPEISTPETSAPSVELDWDNNTIEVKDAPSAPSAFSASSDRYSVFDILKLSFMGMGSAGLAYSHKEKARQVAETRRKIVLGLIGIGLLLIGIIYMQRKINQYG